MAYLRMKIGDDIFEGTGEQQAIDAVFQIFLRMLRDKLNSVSIERLPVIRQKWPVTAHPLTGGVDD